MSKRAPEDSRRVPAARKDRKNGRFVLELTMAVHKYEFVIKKHYKTREQAEKVKAKMLRERYREDEITIYEK